MRKSLAASIIFLSLTITTGLSADTFYLRVVSNQADIRIMPDHNSEIIATVNKGTILEATQKQTDWFLVQVPPEKINLVKEGYIHSSMVETLISAQPAANSPQSPYPPSRAKKLFSGLTLKFGWLQSPNPGDFSNAWIAGLNFDFGLSRNFALGIEIIPAYRSFSDLDLRIVPIYGFVNLKAGFCLGEIIGVLDFMYPYAGAGLGLQAVYTSIGYEGETLTDFSTKPAYHFIGGIQIRLGTINLIGEYQMTQVSNPDIDSNFWNHFLIFGIKFGI